MLFEILFVSVNGI